MPIVSMSNELIPNLLLTNYCNQRCLYCFAQDNMQASKQKQLSLENFEKLIDIYAHNQVKEIRFLGGEPTLHPQFIQIIDRAVDVFNKVWVFSNFVIPDTVNDHLLSTKNSKFVFVANIDTLAFRSPDKQQEIIQRLVTYQEFAQIYIGFTVSSFSVNYDNLLRKFPQDFLSNAFIRFGIAKPMLHEKPFFNPFNASDLQKVGTKICNTVESIRQLRVRQITIDCGLMPTMFSEANRKYLDAYCNIKGWGCDGYWGGFDIDTDLSIIPCFPHSMDVDRRHITDFKNFKEIIETYRCKQPCLLSYGSNQHE